MKNILFFLLIFIQTIAHCQTVKFFTTGNELSSSRINQIYQDHYGMIWIATVNGLNRYDGSKMTIYKHKQDDPHSLCHNFVNTLFEDSAGHLFVGTHNGVQIYDPGKDSFLPKALTPDAEPFDSSVFAFIEHNGKIWASGTTVCSLEVIGDEIIAAPLNLTMPVTAMNQMEVDRAGTVWMTKGDEERGIYKLTSEGKVSHYLPFVYISAICLGLDDKLYVATIENDLFVYDKSIDRFVNIPYPYSQKAVINTLYMGKPGELYIGTDGNGLRVLNLSTWQISDYPINTGNFDSGSLKVHAMITDKDGNMWFGLYQQGVIMQPKESSMFNYIGHKVANRNLIGSNWVSSMFQDRSGTIWVGTANDGIYALRQDFSSSVHFPTSEEENAVPQAIMAIYEDSCNNLWIGSPNNGVAKFDRRSGHCTFFNNNSVSGVFSFAEDNNQRVWMAAMGMGLYYYDLESSEISTIPELNTKLDTRILCLYNAKDNKLYAGTFSGVTCIDLNSENYQARQYLSGCIIHSIYEAPDGAVWVGGTEGLFRIDPQRDTITDVTARYDLSSNAIEAIQGDSDGSIWVSGDAGLTHILPDGQYINYYTCDGIQGNEFSHNCALRTRAGELVFGGMSGIVYFNPQNISDASTLPSIRITDFYLNDKPVRRGMMSGGQRDYFPTCICRRGFLFITFRQ